MRLLSRFLVLVVATVLSACGGGGGGSSSLTYNGTTTPATIDDSQSAAELSALAFYGSDLTDMLPVSSLQGVGQNSVISAPVIQDLTRLVLELPGSIELSSPEKILFAATYSDPPEPCYINGTVSYSGTYNEITGDMKATARFSNCDDGEGYVADGSMSLAMIESGDQLIIDVGLNYFSMDFSTENEKITIDGTVNATGDIYGNTQSLTMNLVLRDEYSGEMAKFNDYQLVLNNMGAYDQMTVSGIVYSSNFGYVELFTVDPILFDYLGPYRGVYRIEGANATWAEVDFSIGTGNQGTFGDATGELGTFSL